MPRIWETTYPILFSLVTGVVIFQSAVDIKSVNNLDLILTSTVTISSIVIAFMGTMISILISLTNEEVMKRIKDNKAQNTLTGYMVQTIIAGLALATYSIIMFMFLKYDGAASNLLLTFLAMLLCFFVFASYRILHITAKILGSVLKEKTSSDKSKSRVKPHINK